MKWLERLLVPMTMVGMLVLSGCAGSLVDSMLSGPSATSGPNVTSGPTSGSTLGPSFKQMESTPADKAVVYIYRPNNPIGAGEWFTGTGSAADPNIPFSVKANGKPVTTLVKGGYYAYLTEPGQIEFTAFDTGSWHQRQYSPYLSMQKPAKHIILKAHMEREAVEERIWY